jgi:hypothetical protein
MINGGNVPLILLHKQLIRILATHLTQTLMTMALTQHTSQLLLVEALQSQVQ